MSPLLADFIHARACKPFCEKSLTLPVLILLGFHLVVEQSVIVCFAHSEHLLKQKYSRLIFHKNQAAM